MRNRLVHLRDAAAIGIALVLAAASPQTLAAPAAYVFDELASPQLVVPPAPIQTTTSGAINNDRGQVLFQATLTDGRGVFLLATPMD